jgi:quercetin dioxygenase-like cupin family protein
MLQTKPLRLGDIYGTIYDFQAVGDALPMHSHEEVDVHISIVARGSFRAHGSGWDKTLSCGDVVDWKANDPHEFIALEPNSRMVNIQKANKQ